MLSGLLDVEDMIKLVSFWLHLRAVFKEMTLGLDSDFPVKHPGYPKQTETN